MQPAPGSNPKLKLYAVTDILRELLTSTTPSELVDVDKMLPPDRKAWFQSERERLKFQQETGELIPASEVTREFSSMAKAMVQVLETLPVDIDVDTIWRIAEHIGATHKQFRAAYSRALKRTAATLRKKAVADMKDGLAPRSLDMVRRRLLSFRLDRSSQSKLDNFRLWFGLNAIKVKDLKGRINGRLRPHHTRRDKSTGRFIKARRQAENAGFTPKGSLLSPRTYENGEVTRSRRENRRTVVIRDPDTRRTREAEIDIYEPMLNYIEDNRCWRTLCSGELCSN